MLLQQPSSSCDEGIELLLRQRGVSARSKSGLADVFVAGSHPLPTGPFIWGCRSSGDIGRRVARTWTL